MILGRFRTTLAVGATCGADNICSGSSCFHFFQESCSVLPLSAGFATTCRNISVRRSVRAGLPHTWQPLSTFSTFGVRGAVACSTPATLTRDHRAARAANFPRVRPQLLAKRPAGLPAGRPSESLRSHPARTKLHLGYRPAQGAVRPPASVHIYAPWPSPRHAPKMSVWRRRWVKQATR
jgi:hypothetical protein